MNILAVDTALGACSVAVVSEDEILAHALEPMERGHAEALAPMVERTMAAAQISFAALDRLGVTVGPGTFTGQRVGLAFMRGLRVALKIPLVGVTSLAAMAHQAIAATGLLRGAAVHDARRGEVYLELCGVGSDEPPSLLSLDDAAVKIAEFARSAPIALAGTAQVMISKRIMPADVVCTAITAPDAFWVARLSAGLQPSSHVPRPLYLRAPDAKRAAARR